LLVEMTTWQKALAMMKAKLISFVAVICF